MDIQQYFPSINHTILKEKLRHYLKDRYVLDVLDRIIDTAPAECGRADFFYFMGEDDLLTPNECTTGLPIGNLTSQFFANLYLDAVDHFIQEQLRVNTYLRYVDDCVPRRRTGGRSPPCSYAA